MARPLVELNPLIAELNPLIYDDSAIDVMMGALDQLYYVRKPAQFLNPMCCTWREMLVTQPPCTEMIVGAKDSQLSHALEGVSNKIKGDDVPRLRAPGGVTMGVLTKEIVRLGLQKDSFLVVQFLKVAT